MDSKGANVDNRSVASIEGGNDAASSVGSNGLASKCSTTAYQTRPVLGAAETKALQRIRIIVFTCLLLSMVGISLSTYYFTRLMEQREFENHFYKDAEKILSSIGGNIERTLQAVDAFVVSVTSMAKATNQTWPFVVVPDFAVRAEKLRSLSTAVVVNMYNYVKPHERANWEAFSAQTGPMWVKESVSTLANYNGMPWYDGDNYSTMDVIWDFSEHLKENPGEGGTSSPGPYLPMWQTHPCIPSEARGSPYNWDFMTLKPSAGAEISAPAIAVRNANRVVISEAQMIFNPDDLEIVEQDKLSAAHFGQFLAPGVEPMEPLSNVLYPIIIDSSSRIDLMDQGGFNTFVIDESNVGALLSLSLYWRDTIKDILPKGSNGLQVVFESPCTPTFTYEINGPKTKFLGAGDQHNSAYSDMVVSALLTELSTFAIQDSQYSGLPINEDFCPFTLNVFPSTATEDDHRSITPILFAIVSAAVFFLTAATFLLYDNWVERRQKIVMNEAVKSSAIVSSLFPENVRDRLVPTGVLPCEKEPKSRLNTFLNSGKSDNKFENGKERQDTPIAELFPDCTVFFADIVGFTAWSSIREPSHVFTLLEKLYGAFDAIARKRGVFKVETIGDSYLAVCGLPEPNKSHAIVMGRFAFECIEKMKQVTSALELSLGPETGELTLRLGLHSGPVTAGVLRGEKARFQLFGDTVNTASRMESTSSPGKIQVSVKTAELIIAGGKGHWLTAREDCINAKGKGLLQTYWLNPKRTSAGSVISSMAEIELEGTNVLKTSLPCPEEPEERKDFQRLVGWNVCLFEKMLGEVVALRSFHGQKVTGTPSKQHVVGNPRKKIFDINDVPNYKGQQLLTNKVDVLQPGLDSLVVSELYEYINAIADLYHDENPFHNFQHASHVVMSTVKLLQRIGMRDDNKKEVFTKKEYFELVEDPLTKFSIVFAALIHDVDHAGVSNMTLVKEKDPIASMYDGKSVMEQHSLDLAWNLLMEPTYQNLRECIYTTQDEYNHFRQLVVNCVLATDIFDGDLKKARDARWNEAFLSKSSKLETKHWHRKATITIEILIQASDVAHTMQHWHVYQKWNKALFHEMYSAYKKGRLDKDPSLGWYQGELWFFDNYIIPLAEKLQECEVFGVACDEFLTFANENRKEWSNKGEEIVTKLVQDYVKMD